MSAKSYTYSITLEYTDRHGNKHTIPISDAHLDLDGHFHSIPVSELHHIPVPVSYTVHDPNGDKHRIGYIYSDTHDDPDTRRHPNSPSSSRHTSSDKSASS